MEDEVIDEVNENTSEVVENQGQVKTYTEEEVNAIREQMKADNQKAWDKRWGREKSKMEREFAKRNELIDLYMEQTGAKNLEELAENSYKQYGVERPKKDSSRDEEILGEHDAHDLISLEDDEILREEYERLAKTKRSLREDVAFTQIESYLNTKKEKEKRLKEIKENGINESILNDKTFIEFANKFNNSTSIVDIYDLYSKTHQVKNAPFTPGSATGGVNTKTESEFFTEEEFMALTADDLENPKIYEKAMKSRLHFK